MHGTYRFMPVFELFTIFRGVHQHGQQVSVSFCIMQQRRQGPEMSILTNFNKILQPVC